MLYLIRRDDITSSVFPYSCRNQSIAEAFEIESRNNVHRVPVLSDDNRLVGILSINDIRLCIESPLFHTNKGLIIVFSCCITLILTLLEIYDSMQKAKVSDVMHKSLITGMDKTFSIFILSISGYR